MSSHVSKQPILSNDTAVAQHVDRVDTSSQPVDEKSFGSQNTLLAVFGLLILILVGYVIFKMQNIEKRVTAIESRPANEQVAQEQKKVSMDVLRKALSNKSLISFGDAKRKVIYTESYDPACPWCNVLGGNTDIANMMRPGAKELIKKADGGVYSPITEEMHKLYDAGKVAMLFVITRGHAVNSIPLRLPYCANEQGKFFEMKTYMAANKESYFTLNPGENPENKSGSEPKEPTAQSVAQYLAPILNEQQLEACLASTKYDKALQESADFGQSIGSRGTPTVFVNEDIVDWPSYETSIKPKIDALLQ